MMLDEDEEARRKAEEAVLEIMPKIKKAPEEKLSGHFTFLSLLLLMAEKASTPTRPKEYLRCTHAALMKTGSSKTRNFETGASPSYTRRKDSFSGRTHR